MYDTDNENVKVFPEAEAKLLFRDLRKKGFRLDLGRTTGNIYSPMGKKLTWMWKIGNYWYIEKIVKRPDQEIIERIRNGIHNRGRHPKECIAKYICLMDPARELDLATLAQMKREPLIELFCQLLEIPGNLETLKTVDRIRIHYVN